MTTTREPLKYSRTGIEAPLKYVNTPEYMFPPIMTCSGCAYGLIYRLFFKAAGPNVVITTLPGCGGTGRLAGIDQVRTAFGNGASVPVGVSMALAAQGDTETVVAPIVGDGAIFDIGMGAFSAAAERNDNMLVVVKDNEGYQNTGGQRSSASPWMTTSATTPPGAPKLQFKKDVDAIFAAHNIPYLATASIGYPDDYMMKVKKAMGIKGFRLIHVLSLCPTGWGFASELTLELSRMAVDTKVFPLFEVENGVKYTINRQPKGLPLAKYTEPQRRFRELDPEDMASFERFVEKRWERLCYLARA
jgi:pyruvate/2-oxoacid:ferredoxin oxidoreductase beta subunit